MSDDSVQKADTTPEESDADSMRTLAKQGIILEDKKESITQVEPRDEFSRELADLGGIEIIPNEDREVL